MINNLTNYLNDPPKHGGVAVTIMILGVLIAIGFLYLLVKNKDVSGWGLFFECLGIMAGVFTVLCSPDITCRLEETNLQTELSSKMENINNEYPYQLSIADDNNDVYFVFCKTKDSQNNVIKTMNTGNNPTIKFSRHTATYMNLPHQIHNGIQAKKRIDEKALLEIVKINSEDF